MWQLLDKSRKTLEQRCFADKALQVLPAIVEQFHDNEGFGSLNIVSLELDITSGRYHRYF